MAYYNWVEIVEKYTNAELIETVKGKRGLHEEKISAATNELKKRGIEPGNNSQILAMSQNEELEHDKIYPQLYSINVIYIFSILFSVLFGSIMLAINLKEVNKRKKIFPVIAFSIIYIALSIYILEKFNFGYGQSTIVNILGSLILNEVFWKYYIGKEIVYRKKDWVKPLLLGIMIIVTMSFIMKWID